MAPRKNKKILLPSDEGLTGNDNLDKALVQLPEMSNTQALDVGLALQAIMKQNQSILNNMDGMGDQLAKLRERMDKYDTDAAKFEANKQSFIDDVMQRAESLKATGDAKDRIVAQGAKMAQDAIQNARAVQATDKLQFEQELARQPKVKVTSPGKIETGILNGQQITRLAPEEVRIRHKVWRFPIGVPVEVPQSVAERLLDIHRSKAETQQLQDAMGSLLEKDALSNKIIEIGNQPGHSKPLVVGMEE